MMTNDPHTSGRFHPDDPGTSKAAAKAIDVGSGQWRALRELTTVDINVGLTDYELAGRLGALATDVGTRRKELEERGYVVTLALRRKTDTGRTAAAHAITEAGLAEYKRLLDTEQHNRDRDALRSSTPAAAGRPTPAPPSRLGLLDPVDRALEEYAAAADGLTDYELSKATGTLRSSAAARRVALTLPGYVERTTRTRRTDRRRLALVTVITDAGRRQLEHLAGAARRVAELDLGTPPPE